MFSQINEMAKKMTAMFDEMNPDYTQCTKQQFVNFRAQYDTDSKEYWLLGLVDQACHDSPHHPDTSEFFNFYEMLIECLYDANEGTTDETTEMEIHLFVLSMKIIYINKITPENLSLSEFIQWIISQLDNQFSIDLLAYVICIMQREGATAEEVLATNYVQGTLQADDYALENSYIDLGKEFIRALSIVANDDSRLKDVMETIASFYVDAQIEQLPQSMDSVLPFSIWHDHRRPRGVDVCSDVRDDYSNRPTC